MLFPFFSFSRVSFHVFLILSYFEDFFFFFCSPIHWWHAYTLQVYMLQFQFQTTWESKWVLQERESAWSSGDWPSLKQMRSLFRLSMVKEGRSLNTAMGVSTPGPVGLVLRHTLPFFKKTRSLDLVCK